MSKALYRLEGVSREFRRGSERVRALNGVTIEIAAGEFVAITGRSGSGKTTLLLLLGGLEFATSGQVFMNERDLARLSDTAVTDVRLREIGFVFQDFNLLPALTASRNIEVALVPSVNRIATRRQIALDMLTRVGLRDRASHLPSQLSGGEQQRVAIGRALANQPMVVLADEPTGNLDSVTGGEILKLLEGLCHDEGTTLVVVTHDQSVAGRADRRIPLVDGRIPEGIER